MELCVDVIKRQAIAGIFGAGTAAISAHLSKFLKLNVEKMVMKNASVSKFSSILANATQKRLAGKISAKGLQGTYNLYGKSLAKATIKAFCGAVARKAILETAIDQTLNLFSEFLKGLL